MGAAIIKDLLLITICRDLIVAFFAGNYQISTVSGWDSEQAQVWVHYTTGKARVKSLSACRNSVQRAPYSLRGRRDHIHLRLAGIQDGIPYRRRDAVAREFRDTIPPKWMGRFERLDEQGLQHRHLIRSGDMVIVQVHLASIALRIIHHLFADRVP